MPRHLNLGKDGYITRLRVRDNLPDIVLCVITAIANGIELHITVGSDHRTVAPSSVLSKLRVFLNLYPPTLIIREVPMKRVHLIH